VQPTMFTSVSAVTITGLATVGTATYWTPFGQAIILLLVEVGGLGIMTLVTLLGLIVGGRIGLRSRLIAREEVHVVNIGEVGPLLRRVAVTMLIFPLCIAIFADAIGFAVMAELFQGWRPLREG